MRTAPYLKLAGPTIAIVRSAAGHYVAGVLRDDELIAAISEITLESDS
ncbi:hypothetical protein [Haloferula sp.]